MKRGFGLDTTEFSRSRYLDPVVLLALCLLGGVLYCQTLTVPWLFDDIQNILENPGVKNLAAALKNIVGQRGVAYLSFALNYRFGGMDVYGFHLANIAFHLFASWIVYLLAKRAFGPVQTGTSSSPCTLRPALLSAAVATLFLVHPLQTQAVNYIVQRMTSLSALFSLMALYAYCRGRESLQGGDRISSFSHAGWYVSALAASALALMTKQNAAVLPALFFLFDWLILNQGAHLRTMARRIVYILPFLLLSILFIYLHVGKDDVLLKEAGRSEYWTRAGEASATKNLTPAVPAADSARLPQPAKLERPPEKLQLIYFVTELSVLWLYIRLLFLPYGQVFDYGYPLVGNLLTVQTLLAGSGLLLLILLAFWQSRRRPLLAFGIFWFFIALSVESTIIPLDAAVEHRLYLPLFGFSVALVSLFRRVPGKLLPALLLCLLLSGYSVAAWQRNLIWSDPIAFARDGVDKAPHNQRNHLTLANAYAEVGRWPDAEAVLRKAIPLRPYYHVPYDNLGSALSQQGRLLEARTYYSMAALLKPDYPDAVFNYGLVSLRLGDMSSATRSLNRLKELRSPLAWKLGAQFIGGRRQ